MRDDWPEDPDDEFYCPYCLAVSDEDHEQWCPLVDVPDAELDRFIDEMEHADSDEDDD